ncbi:aminoglycoside phosphotransferase family protein [Streptomyces sp. NPDC002454]
MNERIEWEELPENLRRVVEACTGTVVASKSVPSGFNCSTALTLHTLRSGRLFFKGVRADDGDGVAGLVREERVNGALGGICPAVRHRFEVGGWTCLAFDHIDGRHVDYGPDAGDLPAVADALRRMNRLPAPGLPLPRLSERLADHLRPGEADHLAGTHLLHTDTNPHNVLIDREGHAHVIDWAMPVLGPAWVDVAYTGRWLMRFGQGLDDVARWLNGFTSWQEADPRAVEAFVNATCRQAAARVGERGSSVSNAQFRNLVDALGTRTPRRA